MHTSLSARQQACSTAEQVHAATRRLTNTQFALEELRAIVEEAEACGTYVCGELCCCLCLIRQGFARALL